MYDLLTIDPGLKVLGWAAWEDGSLYMGGITRATGDLGECVTYHVTNIPVARRVVVERMQHQSNRRQSFSNSLLDVQAVGAACAVPSLLEGGSVRFVYASEWKSTMPKAVHHPRILEALGREERATLDSILGGVPKGNHKEVLDAVGIGLFVLGRIDKAGRRRTGT